MLYFKANMVDNIWLELYIYTIMNATWSVKYDISFRFYPISKNRQSGSTVSREISQLVWIRVRICKNTSVSILHAILNISARTSKPITIFAVFMSCNKAATLYSIKKAINIGL